MRVCVNVYEIKRKNIKRKYNHCTSSIYYYLFKNDKIILKKNLSKNKNDFTEKI